MIRIAPSILSSDFTNLREEIASISESGADIVHLDVMDGHFVPNLTFGPFIIDQIRKISSLPFDVHLMIKNPGEYLERFADSGCDMITVHTETETHLHRTLQRIRNLGKKAGVAFNPHTGIEPLKYCHELIDLVLVMTVNPGFGGQKYIRPVTEKIRELNEFRMKHKIKFDISVDGGITSTSAGEVISAGADILVMGSAFFGIEKSKRAQLVKTVKAL